jgi:serine/threonine protein kinase
LPFNSAIDIFSLGLILAELLLTQPEPSLPITRHRQPSFPTSPPQSHSPQPLHSFPLLSTCTPNRRSFIEQMIRLFGPLPQSFRAGRFWNDEFSQRTFAEGDTLLSQRLENEVFDLELIDFIMRMLNLDPEKRISARDALRHEWLVGPLLGYWAALGVEWTPLERRHQSWRRPVEVIHEKSVESLSSTLEGNVGSVRKLPPLYDFSAIQSDEDDGVDDNEEVSLVYAGASPTKPLPYVHVPSHLDFNAPDERV